MLELVFESIVYALILGMLVALYIAPGIVATKRHHPSRAAIMFLSIVLGWTVIGWLVAMIWALSGDPAAERRAIDAAIRGYGPGRGAGR